MFPVFSKGFKKLVLIPFCNGTSYYTTISISRVSTGSSNKKIKSSKSPKERSFTVSYLVNSCGLSPENARTASEKVHLKTPKKPNSVIELLKNYGLDDTHMSILLCKYPRIFKVNVDKTLLPKLNFFHSIGFSKSEICRLVLYNPRVLGRSLEKQIRPTYKCLKSVILSDQKIRTALKRMWQPSRPSTIVSNVTALRELSVPISSIDLLIVNFPWAMLQRHEKFLEVVKRVKEMEFDPLKCTFVLAIRVLSGKGSKLLWDRCSETYKKWGWSEDDMLLAFKKHPLCMTLSSKKIDGAMDVFVNKLGYEPKAIVQMPCVLFYNMEKRIIPRCLVVQVLTSKGLMMNKVSLVAVLAPIEKIFISRFVTIYDKELPQLMSVYRGELQTS